MIFLPRLTGKVLIQLNVLKFLNNRSFIRRKTNVILFLVGFGLESDVDCSVLSNTAG